MRCCRRMDKPPSPLPQHAAKRIPEGTEDGKRPAHRSDATLLSTSFAHPNGSLALRGAAITIILTLNTPQHPGGAI